MITISRCYHHLVATSVAIGCRLLIKSLRIRSVDLQYYLDLKAAGKPAIVVIWHSRMSLVARHGALFGIVTLVSPSRDGDLGVAAATRLGIKTIRGDSQYQAGKALLKLARTLRSGSDIALFADGPLGPPGQLKTGILALAQITQCPIIPVGAEARWKITFNSWDRFLLPLPFSRVCLNIGPPLYIEKTADSAKLQQAADDLSRHLDHLTEQAGRYCQNPDVQ